MSEFKFPPRLWTWKPPTGGLRIMLDPKSVDHEDTAYMSLEEHEAILRKQQEKLTIAIEALENICKEYEIYKGWSLQEMTLAIRNKELLAREALSKIEEIGE